MKIEFRSLFLVILTVTSNFVIHRVALGDTYVRVPANPAVGTTQDFYIAKYEMKSGTNNVALSVMSDTPWVGITRDEAITKCRALGAAYDLISNAEWQTVARNIEAATMVSNPTKYLNWTNQSISGSNSLIQGNSSGSYTRLAASTDDYPCAGMPAYPNCATYSSPDFRWKRTHTLSTGDVVWDLAGNAQEWVKDNNATTQGADGFLSLKTWNGAQDSRETATSKLKWAPAGVYTAKNTAPYGGLGRGILNYSAGAIFRGGGSNAAGGGLGGLFNVYLTNGPTGFGPDRGFRCVYH